MSLKKQILAGVAVVLLHGAAFAEIRVWHDKDGNYFEGEFVREQLGKVYFKDTSRQTRSIEVTNLAPQSLGYIRTMIPPELEIDFSKNEKNKERNENASPQDQIVVVTGTVKISPAGRTSFEGILRGELYLVGAEVATDDYMMMAKESFPIRFPAERNPSVEFTMSAIARVYEEYNGSQTRGRNYEGYVVVILGPNGDVIKTETNLSWLDDEEFEAFRKLPVRSFFDEDCRKRSVPRPNYYEGRPLVQIFIPGGMIYAI
ncbi:MAG: hypothetical protein JEZ10_08290 [Verrucomicrobia bacterium]|nr:hypothetical protein [Verrucomicrobiota bacterium]